MKGWMIAAAIVAGLAIGAYALDDNGRWVNSGTADEVQFRCRGNSTTYDNAYGVKMNCTTGASEFTGAVTVPSSTITTTKVATSAITTAKLYMDLPTSYVPCVTTAKRLGYCTSLDASTGVCNNCN